jgi:hypothetical protein
MAALNHGVVTPLGSGDSRFPEMDTLLMPAYQFIRNSVLPSFNWRTFDSVLDRHLETRLRLGSFDTDLFPLAACLAAGGSVERAMPLTASWILYVLAGRIFDDLSDGEGADRGLFPTAKIQPRLSACLFATSAAHVALSHLDDTEAYARISAAFSQVLGLAVKSEDVRPTLDALSPQTYFETVAAKTGVVFATGAWAGGLLATGKGPDAEEDIRRLYQYGLHVGMMVQILDDCHDLRVDLANRVWTLPVVYAMSQPWSPQRESVRSLLYDQQEAGDDWAEQAVTSLAQMGAIAWSRQFAEYHRQQAWDIAETFLLNQYLRHYVVPKNQ